MAHTPGPWRVPPTPTYGADSPGEIWRIVSNGEPIVVAEVGRSHPNARLIAAAPELLEALQRIANIEREPQDPDDIRGMFERINDIARAVIAKAKGEA